MMYKIFLIILLISNFDKVTYCQSAAVTFHVAENLYYHEKYQDAITLFKRIAFFDTVSRSDCYYRIAKSYLLLKDYTEAEKYYDFAFHNTSDDSVQNIITMDKALLYLLSGRYDLAQVELFGLDSTAMKKSVCRYNMLAGLSLFGQKKINESKKYLKMILKTEEEGRRLDSLLQIATRWDRRKTANAFYLSLLMPGSGQMLYGNTRESFNSFLLNGTLATLMYIMYKEYSMLDAVFSVLPWFGRYYLGGAIRAEYLAIRKKNEVQDRILSEIITLFDED